MRIYDGSRYLTLLGSKKYDTIHDKIRYLISIKSGITNTISHYFGKIELDSYDSLPIGKTLTLHNAIIHIKSVLNIDKNRNYQKMFLKVHHERAYSQLCL